MNYEAIFADVPLMPWELPVYAVILIALGVMIWRHNRRDPILKAERIELKKQKRRNRDIR